MSSHAVIASVGLFSGSKDESARMFVEELEDAFDLEEVKEDKSSNGLLNVKVEWELESAGQRGKSTFDGVNSKMQLVIGWAIEITLMWSLSVHQNWRNISQ